MRGGTTQAARLVRVMLAACLLLGAGASAVARCACGACGAEAEAAPSCCGDVPESPHHDGPSLEVTCPCIHELAELPAAVHAPPLPEGHPDVSYAHEAWGNCALSPVHGALRPCVLAASSPGAAPLGLLHCTALC